MFSHRLTHIPLPEYSSWDHFQNYMHVDGGEREAGGRGEGGRREGGGRQEGGGREARGRGEEGRREGGGREDVTINSSAYFIQLVYISLVPRPCNRRNWPRNEASVCVCVCEAT